MTPTIQETIDALKIIRRSRCAYNQEYGEPCDCKYGVKILPNRMGTYLPGGEKGNGCPEIYTAINYLRQLQSKQEAKIRQIDHLIAMDKKSRGVDKTS